MTNTVTVDQVNEILIVGGGDVGLMTALQLNNHLSDIDIWVVDDFDQPVPNIGKSTYAAIKPILHDSCNISRNRFINEVRPVWKLSLDFQSWFGCDQFHLPFDSNTVLISNNYEKSKEEFLYRYKKNNMMTRGVALAESNKTPFYRREDGVLSQPYGGDAYHLSPNRFNPFLKKVSTERGIKVINNEITEIEVENNSIEYVASDQSRYYSDLYIDATGFNRSLIGELGNEFKEFGTYLDSAVVATLPIELQDIVPSTVIRSADAGWGWQIDTIDGRDVGYVYSSTHTNKKDATEVLIDWYPDVQENNIREYNFTSGRLTQAWVNNCVAIGNAYGFVEPLQSTSLTVAGTQGSKLAQLLNRQDKVITVDVRKISNNIVSSIWHNIDQFIQMHYKYIPDHQQDTEFIKDMVDLTADSSLFAEEVYHSSGYTPTDFFDSYADNEGDGYTFSGNFITYTLTKLGVGSRHFEALLSEDTVIDRDIMNSVDRQSSDLRSATTNYMDYETLYNLSLPESLPRHQD